MLAIGIKGYHEEVVVEDNTAAKVGSGSLPVYATPAMLAMIEHAANESVQPHLEEGCGSVGTKLDVSHVSATPLGMKVYAETELIEIDRKKLVFSVKAYDETGLIGEGVHERFIINNEKFLAKTNAKLD